MDSQIRDALKQTTPINVGQVVLLEDSERCEGCEQLKKVLSVGFTEGGDEFTLFTLCINCITEVTDKKFASACKMKIMLGKSVKRYEMERKNIVMDITEELRALHPQMARYVDLYLDGRLTMSDGTQHEVLESIYSKTILRSMLPSEAQVKFFNSTCAKIVSAKTAGEEYREKIKGIEVDNLIAGLDVSDLQEKHVDAFINIKKFYDEKGYVSQKQYNYLEVMKNV